MRGAAFVEWCLSVPGGHLAAGWAHTGVAGRMPDLAFATYSQRAVKAAIVWWDREDVRDHFARQGINVQLRTGWLAFLRTDMEQGLVLHSSDFTAIAVTLAGDEDTIRSACAGPLAAALLTLAAHLAITGHPLQSVAALLGWADFRTGQGSEWPGALDVPQAYRLATGRIAILMPRAATEGAKTYLVLPSGENLILNRYAPACTGGNGHVLLLSSAGVPDGPGLLVSPAGLAPLRPAPATLDDLFDGMTLSDPRLLCWLAPEMDLDVMAADRWRRRIVAYLATIAHAWNDGTFFCVLDEVLPIPNGYVFISGWLVGRAELVLIDAYGQEKVPLAGLARLPRSDVPGSLPLLLRDMAGPRSGFLACFPPSGPSRPVAMSCIGVRQPDGDMLTLLAPPPSPVQTGRDLRDRLLSLLIAADDTTLGGIASPALDACIAANPAPFVRSQIFGQPAGGDLSIIMTLRGPAEWMRHQLLLLATQPMPSVPDLLVVMEEGPEAASLRRQGALWSYLAGMGFRLLTLSYWPGDSDALALAAADIDKPSLLFMDAGLLPSTPSIPWLEGLARVAGYGVAGPVLLTPEGRIDSAGLEPMLLPAGGVVATRRLSGLPVEAASAADTGVDVPALPGTCLLLSTALYRRCGGWRSGFLTADAAALDLCRRAAEQGATIRLASGIALTLQRPVSGEADTMAMAIDASRLSGRGPI